MTNSTDRANTVTVLETNECWTLLRATDIGRLAVIVAERPEIFPLNFIVDHGTLVFRSATGAKLSTVSDRAPAALEIDGYDAELSSAWSVVVHGRLEPMISFDLIDADRLPLYPLQGGPKPSFVRIVPDTVTGRRFHTVDRTTWQPVFPAAHALAWE